MNPNLAKNGSCLVIMFFLIPQYWIREENKKQNEKNNALQVASTVFVRTYLGFTIKKVVEPIRNKI